MKLVKANRFKSAKRALKSALLMLNTMVTDVFEDNDNIFKHFILGMHTRIKSIIRVNRLLCLNNGDMNYEKKTTNESINISLKRKLHPDNLNKKKIQLDGIKTSMSDFSSDDDVCLKDKFSQRNDCTSANSDLESEDAIKECLYYVIPEKVNGNVLNHFENALIRNILNNVIKAKRFHNLKMMDDILLRRYEYEEDEVVPDEAIVVSEFMLSGKECEQWDNMHLVNFLSKNIPKKLRKKSKAVRKSFDNGKCNEPCIEHEEKKSANSQCHICKKDFCDSDELKNHLINAHYNNQVECELCAMKFLFKGKLVQHYFSIHSRILECEVCCKQFESLSEKDEHFKTHANEKRCGCCGVDFDELDALKEHYKSTHSSLKKLPNKSTANDTSKTSNEGLEIRKCFVELKRHDADDSSVSEKKKRKVDATNENLD
jgi:hypothetical protein